MHQRPRLSTKLGGAKSGLFSLVLIPAVRPTCMPTLSASCRSDPMLLTLRAHRMNQVITWPKRAQPGPDPESFNIIVIFHCRGCLVLSRMSQRVLDHYVLHNTSPPRIQIVTMKNKRPLDITRALQGVKWPPVRASNLGTSSGNHIREDWFKL